MKTRKLFVVALALVLTLCMTATAFAGTSNVTDLSDSSQNPVSIDVKGTYSDKHTSGTVYSIDISWGSMEFTYSISGYVTWNPTTHKYDDHETTGWVLTEKGTEGTNDAITVKNHSNAPINAELSFNSTVSSVTGGTFTSTSVTGGVFENNTFKLNSAEGTTRDDDNAANDTTPAGTSTFLPVGTLDNSYSNNPTSIGTITVALSKGTVAP